MDYPFMIELSLKCFNLSIAFLTNQKNTTSYSFFILNLLHEKISSESKERHFFGETKN